MCPSTQVRRYAGTQPGTPYGRQVPRSARPINSICPKRLRILPDRLALSLFPVPVHQGVLLPHQNAASPLEPDVQTQHNHRLLSTLASLGGAHPGQTFNLSRVHQPPSERCVASPDDAMRYDTMRCSGRKRRQQQRQQPQVEDSRVVPFGPLPVSPPVSHRVSTVSVLSDCATTADSSFLCNDHAMPCHAVGAREVGVQCRSLTPSSLLDEANCPSGIVYRADGSRFAARPSHASASTSQAHPTADPKCNVQGTMSSARCEWQVFVSSPFLPTALRETE